MAIVPSQHFRFLGGEISPNMYHSADMEQYGKWFSKAENIRFDTLGSFRNRPGFQKIALSKSVNGQDIKLLSFSFSKDENYLIEMGTGYFRFFKNGEIIHAGGDPSNEPYEVQHDMVVTSADIKYVQVGDVIYLANGKGPICTLLRLDDTGYNWEFKKFEYKDSCPPLDEVNTDIYKTLTISEASVTPHPSFYTQFYFPITQLSYLKNVTIDIEDVSHVHHQFSSTANIFFSLPDLVYYFNTTEMSSTYGLVCSTANNDTYFVISQTGISPTILSAKIVTATYFGNSLPKYRLDYHEGASISVPDETDANFSTDGAYLYEVMFYHSQTAGGGAIGNPQINYQYFIENTHSYSLDYAASLFSVSHSNTYSGLDTSANPQIAGESFLVKTGPWYVYTDAYFAKLVTITNRVMDETIQPVSSFAYSITSVGHNFFADKNVGDVFAIKREFEPEQVMFTSKDTGHKEVGAVSEVIKTNGRWGAVSSGAWAGEFALEYSLDGISNWTVFYTTESTDTYVPNNINTAGSLKIDQDVVYIRLRVTKQITVRNQDSHDYHLWVTLYGERVNIWSYYKIANITDNSNATCYCLKNEIPLVTGETLSGIYKWREEIYSQSKGWPSVVSTYQSRLIMARDYLVTASRINDFSDFYERPEVASDDPVTMSLLSNKFNRVKNILTLREFFVFTENGEFGISSAQALTQSDKTLKPLSYHGSNNCEPVLAGNLALFVDSTENTVRLFKYSYETDAFEASDASVFLEQLLASRRMVSSAYIKKTKEAMFLDNEGTIWVFKLLPEQEVYAWSHWKYAKGGKITNICAVTENNREVLYVAVEDYNLSEKRIERLEDGVFTESEHTYTSETAKKVWTVGYPEETELLVDAEGQRFRCKVDSENSIGIPINATEIVCRYPYKAEATLLSPVTKLTEELYTTYNKGKPFKVRFYYQDSFGFKVGVDDGEKMYVRFNQGDKYESSEPTTGKREVLIPAKYDGTSRVSFVQERPYNMAISNVMIDMDYGGK